MEMLHWLALQKDPKGWAIRVIALCCSACLMISRPLTEPLAKEGVCLALLLVTCFQCCRAASSHNAPIFIMG